MAYDAFDSFRKAVGGFKSDFEARTPVELGEEFIFVEKTGRGLRAAVHDGHEEVASPSGIPDGPDRLMLGSLGYALERTEPGDAALMDLGNGLGGGDANAGPIVAAGSGADDDRGKTLSIREFREERAEGREKIAFL